MLADYTRIIQEIDASVRGAPRRRSCSSLALQMGSLFSLRPREACRVERVPAFKEKGAPGTLTAPRVVAVRPTRLVPRDAGAYYFPPAMDGSRPGIFYANLSDLTAVPRLGMRTLAYHEARGGRAGALERAWAYLQAVGADAVLYAVGSGGARPPLSAVRGAVAQGAATVPARGAVHGLRGGLGAVCRTAGASHAVAVSGGLA